MEAAVQRLKISGSRLSADDCVPSDASQLRLVYFRHGSRTLFYRRKAWSVRYPFRSFARAESSRYSENDIEMMMISIDSIYTFG